MGIGTYRCALCVGWVFVWVLFSLLFLAFVIDVNDTWTVLILGVGAVGTAVAAWRFARARLLARPWGLEVVGFFSTWDVPWPALTGATVEENSGGGGRIVRLVLLTTGGNISVDAIQSVDVPLWDSRADKLAKRISALVAARDGQEGVWATGDPHPAKVPGVTVRVTRRITRRVRPARLAHRRQPGRHEGTASHRVRP